MENEVRLIDAVKYREMLEEEIAFSEENGKDERVNGLEIAVADLQDAPTIDPESLRPKGRWILEAHNERVNYRWNVTAECSECCDEKKEIWAGFFPNVPDSMAKEVSLMDAKQVKLSNFCPNCGADMRGESYE